MDYTQLTAQARQATEELLEAAHLETGDIFVLHRNLRFYLLCVSGLPWRSPSFLTLGWPEIEVKSPAIFNTSYFIS